MMKSKTSLFDVGLSKNVLKRAWPLWLAYFVLIIFELPIALFTSSAKEGYYGYQMGCYLNSTVYTSAELMTNISFVFSIIAAMVLFHFLYTPKYCSMIAALPIKRATVFCTVCITGIVPFMVVDIICATISFVGFGGHAELQANTILIWLAVAVMTNVVFYAFAVFCAMLTGNLFVLPAVYVVLNLAAYIAELAMRAIGGVVVYGYMSDHAVFTIFSPFATLIDKLNANYDFYDNIASYKMSGLDTLLVYFALSIIPLVAAYIMYINRRMETAGDTVAIRFLKPLFKYCLCFGTAIVAAAGLFKTVLDSSFFGFTASMAILVLLLVGAFIGYFVAEMLIQKTFFVFHGSWKGLFISFAVLAGLTFTAEFDVLGYEKYVPELNDIAEVEIKIGNVSTFSEPENISTVLEMHQSYIDEKDEIEAQKGLLDSFYLSYKLKNGNELHRRYYYAYARPDNEPEAYRLLNKVLNADEIKAFKYPELPHATEDNIAYYEIYYHDGNGHYKTEYVTTAQALELYKDCIVKDVFDSSMGTRSTYQYNEIMPSNTTCRLSIGFTGLSPEDYPVSEHYIELVVTTDAKRTIKWLKENTAVEIIRETGISW